MPKIGSGAANSCAWVGVYQNVLEGSGSFFYIVCCKITKRWWTKCFIFQDHWIYSPRFFNRFFLLYRPKICFFFWSNSSCVITPESKRSLKFLSFSVSLISRGACENWFFICTARAMQLIFSWMIMGGMKPKKIERKRQSPAILQGTFRSREIASTRLPAL